MTIYNAYQEAKIANPESDIYINEVGKFQCYRGALLATKKCNPANHCMTVENFLADGHKLQVGDVCLDDDGDVVHLSVEKHTWNNADKYDSTRYILRAEALNKPKRTKAKYVKCDNSEAAYWFLKTDEPLYAEPDDSQRYDDIQDYINNMDESGSGSLYRRIETEIDWRDELIEALPAGYGLEKFGSSDARIIGLYSKDQMITLAESILKALK